MRDKKSPDKVLFTQAHVMILHLLFDINTTLPDRVDLPTSSSGSVTVTKPVDECPHTCINITSSFLRCLINLKTDVQRFPLPRERGNAFAYVHIPT